MEITINTDFPDVQLLFDNNCLVRVITNTESIKVDYFLQKQLNDYVCSKIKPFLSFSKRAEALWAIEFGNDWPSMKDKIDNAVNIGVEPKLITENGDYAFLYTEMCSIADEKNLIHKYLESYGYQYLLYKRSLKVSALWDTDPVTIIELKKRGLHLGDNKESVYIERQDPESGVRKVPTSVNGVRITEIRNPKESVRTFSKVIIPDSVTTIGNYAFYNCSGLTSIIIPESVTNIGDSAFERCSGLTSITIPSGVTIIGHYAFYNCSKLISITIPNNVTGIGNYTFCNVPHIYYHGKATGAPWGAKEMN